jgi:hypothetical protein
VRLAEKTQFLEITLEYQSVHSLRKQHKFERVMADLKGNHLYS